MPTSSSSHRMLIKNVLKLSSYNTSSFVLAIKRKCDMFYALDEVWELIFDYCVSTHQGILNYDSLNAITYLNFFGSRFRQTGKGVSQCSGIQMTPVTTILQERGSSHFGIICDATLQLRGIFASSKDYLWSH